MTAEGLTSKELSISTDSFSDTYSSLSSKYQEAKLFGYDLSKSEYIQLYKYAKAVYSENLNHLNDSSHATKFNVNTKMQKNSVRFNSNTTFFKRDIFPEELWIQILRDRIASEVNGYFINISFLSYIYLFRSDINFIYKSIKLRELNIQDEIRRRRRRLTSQSSLPVLPEGARELIAACLRHSDTTEHIEKFCIPITTRDLRTLQGSNWLNDEILNFYFELLLERSKSNSTLPNLHIFNTFFYPRLKNGGFSQIRRWTKKIDIFSFDMILIPIHLGIHWCCAEINFKTRTIIYYDSLHSENNECLRLLHGYLIEEYSDKKGNDGVENFNFSSWRLLSPKNIPSQQNGYDCGVFACIFAEFRSRGMNFTFSQKDMKYFRERISYEILIGKLL